MNKAMAIVVALLAGSVGLVANAGVPYEFERANRVTDDVTPLIDFEDGDDWRVVANDGEGKTSLDGEDRLFGAHTLRLDFRGTGEKASVAISPRQVKALPGEFDTIYVWAKGNCFGRGANTDPTVPTPTLYARFRLTNGEEREIKLSDIDWPDWHQINRRLTAAEIVVLKGGAFVGLVLKGGKQAEWRNIHFDNLAIFVDDLKTPIAIKPRPRRPITPLPGAVQGINTGKEWLRFPNSRQTILPKTSEPNQGDLLAKFNGGAVNPAEAKALQITERRSGKSLIVTFSAPAGKVREVTAGSASEAKVVKSFLVPYFNYGDRKGRIKIDLLEGGWFRSAVFDWYRSNASTVASRENEFTMRYLPKTDGTYNPVSEQLVITVSRDFQEVLPEIPNPASPYRAITGTHAWRAHASYNHDFDKRFWSAVRAAGIRHVVINDHETMWRDRGESFTCRTEAAPGRGGDEGAYDYTRYLRNELKYEYGPYNNFTDFAPMNANWRRDLIARRPDGSLQSAWVRCYGPKPALVPELCERIVPEAQKKFGFSTAYCDVHTAATPWSRTDYDARVPGAATFAQTFYAWGELMMLQKKFWEGPVYSEGGCHFLYAGLADGNYAQDGGYDFLTMPWIVDFDLLKIHPKECDFGMGTLSMFSPGKTLAEIRFYQPHAPTEKDRDELIDLFLTASAAYGHAPFLILDYCFDPPKPFGLAYGGAGKLCLEKGLPIALKSYAMLQPIAARYTQSAVRRIVHFAADGRELTSSEAIVSGEIARNQLAVEYANGTFVVANGNPRERMKVNFNGVAIDLPTRAFKAWTSDGQIRAEISEDAEGRRRYFSECQEFVYDNGVLTEKTTVGEMSSATLRTVGETMVKPETTYLAESGYLAKSFEFGAMITLVAVELDGAGNELARHESSRSCKRVWATNYPRRLRVQFKTQLEAKSVRLELVTSENAIECAALPWSVSEVASTVLFPGIYDEEDPPPADRVATLAAMARLKPAEAKIVERGGRNVLEVDGKLMPFNQYKGFTDYRNAAECGGDLVMTFNRGDRLFLGVSFDKSDRDPKTGEWDFSRIEDTLLRIYAANPKARVVLSVAVDPDQEFLVRNPDVIFTNEKGERGWRRFQAFAGFTDKPLDPKIKNAHWTFSYASFKWRQYVIDGLERLCAYLKTTPAANIIIGFHIAGGMDGQFVQWQYGQENGHFDYSEENRRALGRYLKEVYGTESALQQAWGDPNVTFDTAKNPTVAEFHSRVAFDDKPGFGRRLADCRRFVAIGPAQTINAFARTLRNGLGRPCIVDTWYTSAIWSQPGRLAIDELTKNGGIDTIITVSEYSHMRALNGPGASADNAIAGLNLRGLMFVQEMDHRTWRTEETSGFFMASESVARPRDELDYANQVRRDAASVIAAGGAGFHLFDMFGSWHHGGRIRPAMREIFALNRWATEHAGEFPRPRVAIFMDEQARLLKETVYYESPCVDHWWRTSGVTPAIHYLSDLDNPKLPDYDLMLVDYGCTITRRQVEELKRRGSQRGKTVVISGEIATASRDYADMASAMAELGPSVRHYPKGMSPKLFSELVKSSGVHAFGEPGNATYVGNGVAAVHSLGCPAKVTFDRQVRLVNPLTGNESEPTREWRPTLKPGESAATCYRYATKVE